MKRLERSKINELGSMMVEALAMLGLISMVTPVVYKKAAERNTEMQDVNSAAQLRNLVRAVDEYVQDNYEAISKGDKVDNGCKVASVNFNNFKGSTVAHKVVDIRHLCDYLPYGFLETNGEVSDNKIFSKNYKIAIKKTEGANSQSALTGFLVAQPNQGSDFSRIRASRISSMIGGNGGYVENGNAFGVQGMWQVADINTNLGIAGAADGSIITTSAQPISSGKANYDDVLHRVYKDNEALNRMETSLMMGRTAEQGQNIENANRVIITAANATPSRPQGSVNEADWKEKALWVKGTTAGAYIDGMLKSAEGKFSVDKDSNVVTKGALSAADNKFIIGTDGNFTVDATGNTVAKGTLSAATGNFTVDGSGNTVAKGTLSAANTNFTVDANGNTVVKGDLAANKRVAINGAHDADTNYKLTVNGNAIIKGLLRVTKFKADNIDAGVLKAGTTNVMSDNRQDYTLYTDSARLVVGATSAADNVGVFNIDRVGYTYAKGLRAGLVNGSLYPFTVGNDTNSNINMRLRTTASTVSVRNSANSQDLLNITDTTSKLSSATSGNFSEVYLDGDQASLGVGTGTGGNKNLTVYKSGSTTTGVTRPQVWVRNGTDLKVLNAAGNVILNVDQSEAMKTTAYSETTDGKSRGSVYVRKGVIELASNHGQNTTNPGFASGSLDTGYVKADMLVSQEALESNAVLTFQEYYGGSAPSPSNKYDMYMVNPAYTSVMHDIKLTSRGGARLSDILPDFINKGIYVADNSYLESSVKEADLKEVRTGLPSATVITQDYQLASAWLGVVPAPQCPAGYQKVVSVVPMSFKMAEAEGVYGIERDGFYAYKDPHEQIEGYNEPYIKSDEFKPVPLTFQKNTFLKVLPVKHFESANQTTFRGWSVLMGFIYPISEYKYTRDNSNKLVETSYYKKYAGETLQNNTSKFVWNLYPVYGKTLDALVTVYCYFDRGQFKNGNLVDRTYDQLNNFRGMTDKNNSGYTGRLNDPKLKYNDVW